MSAKSLIAISCILPFFRKKPVQRVLRAVGRVGNPWPCTFPYPNATFIATHITYICAFGRRRRCKYIGFKLFPNKAFGALNCALRPFPFVPLRGPLRESLVLVRALRLGGVPLCLGGWACLFGRPFSGDLRPAVLPISLFLLRFVWRESNHNKKHLLKQANAKSPIAIGCILPVFRKTPGPVVAAALLGPPSPGHH